MTKIDTVTGGAGFIGSHLVEALLERGRMVRVLDNFSTGREENLQSARAAAGNRLELVRGDIRDPAAVERAVAGAERVFHLAAMVSVQQSVEDPRLCHDVNVTGTLQVLEAARRGAVRRVVLASTCAVYGDDPRLPKAEDMVPQPQSPYAASKWMNEIYADLYRRLYGVEAVALRFFNVYGPRQDPNSEYAAVIPKFVDRLRHCRHPVIFGDGRQTRDFVYVGDVVAACLAAAEGAGKGGVYNVGSGRRYSLLELVEVLDLVLGTRTKPEFGPPRPGEVRHSVAAVGKIEQELGWRPAVGLEEGLRTMVGGGAGSGGKAGV